jgi:cytochrome c5
MKTYLFATFAALLSTAAFAQTPPQLPPGEGRDIVAVACSQCHPVNVIMSMRKNNAGWRAHVYDMFVRGAQVTDTEVETVIDYLTANFGPGVNVPAFEPAVLPDGAGKELVAQRCGTACHDLRRVTVARHGRKDWDSVVKHMLEIGAPLTPDDAKTITTYLSDKFGAK